jgi:type I restriction enzyme S subunit
MSEFAARYITSITPLLIENCRGATIQGLTRDFIHQIKIPLPPVSEQKRISQILNEQMAAVEKARAAAETELETINSLPAVILRQAFSGDL